MLNKDEVQGKATAIKGKVKEAVGNVTDNQDLASEGRGDQVAGRVQEAVGTVKRKVAETGDNLRKQWNDATNAASRESQTQAKRPPR